MRERRGVNLEHLVSLDPGLGHPLDARHEVRGRDHTRQGQGGRVGRHGDLAAAGIRHHTEASGRDAPFDERERDGIVTGHGQQRDAARESDRAGGRDADAQTRVRPRSDAGDDAGERGRRDARGVQHLVQKRTDDLGVSSGVAGRALGEHAPVIGNDGDRSARRGVNREQHAASLGRPSGHRCPRSSPCAVRRARHRARAPHRRRHPHRVADRS